MLVKINSIWIRISTKKLVKITYTSNKFIEYKVVSGSIRLHRRALKTLFLRGYLLATPLARTLYGSG